jgi:energy-coupling factor transport system substrate-specific component
MQSRAKSIRELKNEMITDPMTGILNKAGANRLIGDACEKETGMLVMIDLDSFKLVNDIYGHDMGDKVLIRFAELIKENIREEDMAGRLGGDEFMAFLKDTLDEEAVERLCRALNAGIVRSAKEYMGEGMNIPLGASLGAVKITGPGGDYDDLFRKADKALYSVKQNGKHGYAFYEKSGSEKDDDKDWDNKNNLEQIKKIISERNEGKGAYRITFEKMQVIYRFLSRDDRMKGNDTAFFRIVPASGGKRIEDDLLESIADELVTKLKRDDVVSIYAGCIFVMMRDMKNSDCMDRLKKITDGWLADNGKEKEIKISMEMDVV